MRVGTKKATVKLRQCLGISREMHLRRVARRLVKPSRQGYIVATAPFDVFSPGIDARLRD
jgi:hypothetical protein